jgi:hypothetical protein
VEPDRLQRELLNAIEDRLQQLDTNEVPRVRDLNTTWSYDIQPPKPDAGIGVACWVVADAVGAAADTVWQLVSSAMTSLAIEGSLWDLRVLPRNAVSSRPGDTQRHTCRTGTPDSDSGAT